MRSGPVIFAGIAVLFTATWLGLVVAPGQRLGALQPLSAVAGGDAYPGPLTGLAARGRAVYIACGCLDCHTQQVRPPGLGSDIARGWGSRRSVPRDYIEEQPPVLGTSRTGPDLANIGARRPDANWHHLHLYGPRAITPGSIMPSYRYLYELHKIVGQPSHRAVRLPEQWKLKSGYELVPSEEATALVAYLLALDHSAPLEEAGAR